MAEVFKNKPLLYGEATKVPAIPDVRSTKPEMVISALKEWVEVREGARGATGLDRAVTVRDLLNTGTLKPEEVRGVIPNVGDIRPPPGTVDPDVPPTPTNLVAAGAVENIILTWDFARGYSRLAYFEVWRSEENLLGTALKVAQVFEPIYADNVGPGRKYYYWVRAVSDAGTSPYNSLNGTLGETAINIEEVIDAVAEGINDSGLLDQLTIKTDENGLVTGYGPANTPSQDDGTNSVTFAILADRFLVAGPASGGVIPAPPFFVQTTPTTVNGVAVPAGVYIRDGFIQNGVITNAKIGNLAVDNAKIADVSAAKLTAGQLKVGAFIESSNYLAGDTGFHINGNGNAEFSNAVVRGTIFASAGRIGNAVIDASGVQSVNYTASTGWRIGADGKATFNEVKVRGEIVATSGNIGGNVINATGIQSPNYTATTGWRIDSSGNAQFNSVSLRGSLRGGSFTGYAWPASPSSGFYLGPEGMLIGDYYAGKYVWIEANGNLMTPGFRVVNGVLTVNQANVIDTLNVAGNAITVPAGARLVSNVSSGTPMAVSINSNGAPMWVCADIRLVTTSAGQAQVPVYVNGNFNSYISVIVYFQSGESFVGNGTGTLFLPSTSGGVNTISVGMPIGAPGSSTMLAGSNMFAILTKR